MYRCFDPGTQATSTEVYRHEIPGGQYTNMLFQVGGHLREGEARVKTLKYKI